MGRSVTRLPLGLCLTAQWGIDAAARSEHQCCHGCTCHASRRAGSCEGAGSGLWGCWSVTVLVLINSRTKAAHHSHGAVLQLCILQWPLYQTVKNERGCINQQHIYSESTCVFQRRDPKSFPGQWWMLCGYWCEQGINCCSQPRRCSRGRLGISSLHRSCFPEIHFHIPYFERGRQKKECCAVTMTCLYLVFPSALSTWERMM